MGKSVLKGRGEFVLIKRICDSKVLDQNSSKIIRSDHALMSNKQRMVSKQSLSMIKEIIKSIQLNQQQKKVGLRQFIATKVLSMRGKEITRLCYQ